MKELTKKITESIKTSVIAKMFVIAILILLFLIPLGMINAVIRERETNRIFAEGDIINLWGGDQVVGGPFLHVPYIIRRKDEEGNIEEFRQLAHFLPDFLEIEGVVEPETRSRGIYEVTVYNARLKVSGTFGPADFSDWRISGRDILWDDAYLSVEFPDMRALKERVQLTWGDRKIDFQAGKASVGMFSGEIWGDVPDLRETAAPIDFSFELAVSGGRSLGFVPLGAETKVKLSSPWTAPSFAGSFLPLSRSLGEQGFEADWYVLSLGRSYPQKWKGGEIEPGSIIESQFRVDLMIPVDTYMKTLRSVKYGILFIFLPFVTFFLFEAFSGKKIHPLQYMLVGFAVSLFYLLLLSISEHLSFDLTYLLASVATVALITFYSHAVLKSKEPSSWGRSLIMAPVLSAAYIFLYVLLQSEDYALLIGSLGLFVILAGIMIVTRRLDWYSLGKSDGAGKAAAGNVASEK
jgi:inner membrane protein